MPLEDRGASPKSGPKASPRALAAWESLFAALPNAAEDASAEDAAAEDASAEDAAAAADPSAKAQLSTPVAAPDEARDEVQQVAQAPQAERVQPERAQAERAQAEGVQGVDVDGSLRAVRIEPQPSQAALEESTAPESAETEDDDRPASPFHVYEWVLRKLEDRPATTFLQLRRLGERGNFTVSEGHYKRARREIDGRMSELRAPQIDALVEDTLALIRKPIEETRRLRAAALEIAEICDEALASVTPSAGIEDVHDFELSIEGEVHDDDSEGDDEGFADASGAFA